MQKPKIDEAFTHLLDVLREQNDRIHSISDQRDSDVAESYQNLMDLLHVAIDCYVQNSPANPRCVELVSPYRKFGGDNQQARYYLFPVNSAYEYRLEGHIDGAAYIGLTVYGCDTEDELRIVENTNSDRIDFRPDGSFAVDFKAEGEGNNCVRLSPDANQVVIRQYFSSPIRRESMPVSVSLLNRSVDRAVPGTEDMARRLRSTANFLKGWFKLTPMPWPVEQGAYNQICEPLPAAASSEHGSTPDNIHAFGYFNLEDDQALVLKGKMPRCRYWSCHLWTGSMQTYDFEKYHCAISDAQLDLDDDDQWTIVLSNRLPQGRNWLDTAGHQRGFVYFRWLLSSEKPGDISAEVVPIAHLSGN